MTKINYCPECGHKVNGVVKFCSECGAEINRKNIHNNKRDRVLKAQKNKSRKGFYFSAVSGLIIAALIFYINTLPSEVESTINKQPKISEVFQYPPVRYDHIYSMAIERNGKIILPLDVVKDKKFVKFDIAGNKRALPILAYLTEDGKVVTAISLCEPCDSKNFHIVGSTLVCNSCGTTWDLNNLEALSGSCGKYPPDPVPSSVVGNEIQIDQNLVNSWTRRI